MVRVTVRPSKPTSIIGVIMGLVMVGIGVVVVIPTFGLFGVVWTMVAAAIAVFHGVSLLLGRGVAEKEIEIEPGSLNSFELTQLPFDERLRRLEQLRSDGLLSEQEYQQKRAGIMKESW